MDTAQLGRSGPEISRIGFGAWAIGGSWGPIDDSESIAAINQAIDQGVNWIDTAAVYGKGHSEEIVAKALNGRAQRPYIFTKCTRVWDSAGNVTTNAKAPSIRREIEDSLRRLQVEVIDLYQIHGWQMPEEDTEEAWSTLVELRDAGKARFIGVSNFSLDQLQRAQAIAPVDSLQMPYSLLNREIEGAMLDYCTDHQIGVLAYSPMGSGLLSGKMTRERVQALPKDDWRRDGDPEFQEPLLTRNLAFVEQLRSIASRHRRTPGELAINWVLQHPATTGAIVGFRRPQQVDELVEASDFALTQEDMNQIDELLAAR
jgi:aryl-alcohol dehydrogenase-like predicted oxidoreductase